MVEPRPTSQLGERPSRRVQRTDERSLRRFSLRRVRRGRSHGDVEQGTAPSREPVCGSRVPVTLALDGEAPAHDDRVAVFGRVSQAVDHGERDRGIAAPGRGRELPLVRPTRAVARRERVELGDERSRCRCSRAGARRGRRGPRRTARSAWRRLRRGVRAATASRGGSADSIVPRPAVSRFSSPASPRDATVRSSMDRLMPAALLVDSKWCIMRSVHGGIDRATAMSSSFEADAMSGWLCDVPRDVGLVGAEARVVGPSHRTSDPCHGPDCGARVALALASPVWRRRRSDRTSECRPARL